MSTKTGLAPTKSTELAEEIKVKGEVITSSPGPMPWARRARCSAVVPEEVATAWRTPHMAAKALSNSSTLGPWASIPDFRTAMMASFSSSPINGWAIGIIYWFPFSC